MARLEWNAAGSRFYEAGVDRGVLYIDGQAGVPWIGLTSVEEGISGGESKPFYIDGVKYLNLVSAEEFEATINAFTYPDSFAQCDGSARVRPGLFLTQQRRKSFGLSYRTRIGDDVSGVDRAYKIHLIYNALASPSERTYETTTNDATEPVEFSWGITTKPPAVAGYKRTAHVVIDSRETNAATLTAVEDILYGDLVNAARMPTIAELIEVFDTPLGLEVIDNGDGTYTITGPDSAILTMGPDTVQITWPTVVSIGTDTYRISSD